jgi:hypothetical protein
MGKEEKEEENHDQRHLRRKIPLRKPQRIRT